MKLKRNIRSKVQLPEPDIEVTRPTYHSLVELEYEPLDDDKYELIEHIQETFGQGRNEVEAMINEHDF